MSAIVKLGDVYKSFGSNQVLKGVSLEVAKGEMIAVIGATVFALGLEPTVESEPVTVLEAQPIAPPPPSTQPPPAVVVAEEVKPEVEPVATPEPAPPPAEAPEKPKRHRAVKTSRVTKSAEKSVDPNNDSNWSNPAAANGSLTLVTEPWANVYLGGKSLGMTPLVKVSLPVGRHTLKLIGEDHKPVALTVEIEDGNETRVRVPLSMLKAL